MLAKPLLQLVFCSLLAGLVGCAPNGSSPASVPGPYPDLAALAREQAQQLAARQPPVRQRGRYGLNPASDEAPAQVNWPQVLEMLQKVDLNKPTYRGAYQVDSTADRRVYTARRPDMPARRVEMVGPVGAPRLVRVQYQESQYLYQTGQTIELRLANQALQFYRIKGYQHFIFNDTVFYDYEMEIFSQ
ncbi:MAG: hypothetical protein MUC97_10630 [Bernardetiaceae bacterium]|nr:hypothetical protein [Bernardetiaceae bacterium]